MTGKPAEQAKSLFKASLAFLRKEFAIFAQLGRDRVRGGRVTLFIAIIVSPIAGGTRGGCGGGGGAFGLIVLRLARR